MKIVVLDGYALNPGDLSWEELERLGAVEIHDRTPEPLAVERLQGAAVAFTNKTPLSRATQQQLPGLRYIGVLATGYNIVDVASARERGITVTNIPTYGTASVAQLVFALLLELCHRTGVHDQAVRNGEWTANPDWCFWKSPLIELAGRTMGIVGYGRIGRQTAAIARAFGMRVVAHDAFPSQDPDVEWMSLDDLLAASDVVSLHCPLVGDNAGMINTARLTGMKPSAFLINTSRGPLVAEQDLADALNNGVIAGAGLDVLSVEPPPASNPLLTARNCILTPHIAWATKEARARLLGTAVGNLRAFLDGSPRNTV